MIKKALCLLLVFALSMTFFGCGKKTENEPSETEEYILPTQVIYSDISLPYISTDSLDPYLARGSLNRDLIPVIYESLFVATRDGKGKSVLASKGEIKNKTVEVSIFSNVLFSDGSTLTANDVKASFIKAKNNRFYGKNLANFADAKVIANNTIQFILFKPDFMALNCLNFPIVKGEDEKCFGTGKYSVEYLESIPYLQVNINHRDFKKEWNKQIALYDMAGATSPIYPFKANKISVYKNDLSTGEYINLSSKTVPQNMNNLVYVGVNSNWAGSITSLKWVKQAINIGLDRKAVTAESFLGQGEPTVTPFKTGNYQVSTENLPTLSGETEKAVSILKRNGYKTVNSEGLRTNGSRTLSLNILVCTENPYKLTVAKAVKASLQDLGFNVTITEKKKSEDFLKALKAGHYSLYIGETQLTDNCDLSEFFTKKGKLNYGISDKFFPEYEAYENGKSSTMTFVESFSTEVPFIPLFYRNAVVSINPNVTGVDEGYNIYGSVSDWKLKKE